ncbi:MAG TPA: SDR family NAD(P)-dependent oxidoreductase [Gammaproteobacteria bacterium]
MNFTLIVTGASRGIGAAVARAAAGAGMNVVLNARSTDALRALSDALGGDDTAVVAGDVSEAGTCRRIVAAALEKFGRIDALINNAGILEPVGALDRVSGDDWARNLRVNVLGPVLMSQAAIPALRQSRGRVINISSGAAVKAVRGWSAYCTSKAALNHFNRMLAAEFPEITAIAVSPGMTATDMQVTIRSEGRGRMPDGEYQRFVDAHERGELRDPREVAGAVLKLARHAPPAWSGEFLTVDDPRIARLDDAD